MNTRNVMWKQKLRILSLSTLVLFWVVGTENQYPQINNSSTYGATDRAYLAGFFDGDGAIMAIIEYRAENKFGYKVRLEAKITQKQREILDELQKLFGVGRVKVTGPAYEWIVKNREEMLAFIDLMLPYTRIKYNQLILAKEIAAKLEQNKKKEDLVESVRLAYILSSYNIKSKRRNEDQEIIIKSINERAIRH